VVLRRFDQVSECQSQDYLLPSMRYLESEHAVTLSAMMYPKNEIAAGGREGGGGGQRHEQGTKKGRTSK
jgi:hypothetical protein